MTTLFQQSVPVHDELAGRLAEHLVAGALVRKSVTDPVPFPVWWRVTDALRVTVLGTPTDALPEVEAAITALLEAVHGLAQLPTTHLPVDRDDPQLALRRAQVLVARLVFSTAPSSPSLLHVRLARLRRALVDAAAG
jgi:hypothetical protein